MITEVKFSQPIEITEKEAKTFLAIKLFEMEKISLGKAAELAEYPKAEFMKLLGKYKIPVFNYAGDFEQELKTWETL